MQQERPEQNRQNRQPVRTVLFQAGAASTDTDTAGAVHQPTPQTGRGVVGPVRLGLMVTTGLLVLGGCRHQDAVDSTLEWTQKMRGGVIATQRPPPPGRYDPYPHVGLTPTKAPDLPSPQARAMLTEQLIRDRNLTYRTVAANGTLTPVIPPQPNAAAAPKPDAGKTAASSPAQNAGSAAKNAATNGAPGKPGDAAATPGQDAPSLPPGMSGAIMDAAESSPTQDAQKTAAATQQNAKAATDAAAKAAKAKKKADQAGQDADMPELSMPEVSNNAQKPSTPPAAIPQIPAGPPAPPEFPGFDVPSDANLRDAPRPNYDLNEPKGTALHFMPQSDQLSSGQNDTLAKLVQKTPHGPFYVRGFGNSASLSAQDQADAVQLGLLRAERVSKELIKRGVPSDTIHIRGDAFGTGVRVANSP